jgi:hypothetical protein
MRAIHRIKILTNGGHFGVGPAIGCCMLGRLIPSEAPYGKDVYEVKRCDLEAVGANPYSSEDRFTFTEGVECVRVAHWETFREWIGF